MYLIDNMDGHHSPEGRAMRLFHNSLSTMDESASIGDLYKAWNEATQFGAVVFKPDSSLIDNQFLIENIDEAFASWDNAPWKKEITFSQFCDYILPYRVKDEHLSRGWRTEFRKKYLPLITGITDLNKAFSIISKHIQQTIIGTANYTPYNFDVKMCEKIKKATCDERSVLQICVLRSLGIPAALDVVPFWADYSTRGHSWVSLVMSDGSTFTINEQDSIALQYNTNDAQFKQRYKPRPSDHCPYIIKTEKHPAKIFRMGYRKDHDVHDKSPYFLSNPFAMDVSQEYGLTAQVVLPTDNTSAVYLCAYLTGVDWMPIAVAYPHNGHVTFKNVGKNIVCTAMTYNDSNQKFLTSPFLIGEKNIEKFFNADTTVTRKITVTRKYPLYPYISDQWGFMRGAAFEGSNDPKFIHLDTLATISTMPYSYTSLRVEKDGKYRYLRYRSQPYSRISLAEIVYYTHSENDVMKKITGKNIFHGVDSTTVVNLYDNNPATTVATKDVGYWVGLDLGEPQKISHIEFMPNSDTNFIEPNDIYELYYFDTKWQLLSRQKAQVRSLSYDTAPSNALFLIKNKTKGREERIFEYSNNTQIWY